VRMRPDIDALPGDELDRSHLVEEDEWADHLPLGMRQGATHLETAEIAGPRHDHQFEGVARSLVAGDRIVGRMPAHLSISMCMGRLPFLMSCRAARQPLP